MNIFLTTDGASKVGDFGLALRLDGEAGVTRSGTAVGTPKYMAPDQAGEATVAAGSAADVYALESILYELLTGRPPFRSERADVTLFQLITQDPITPSRRNPKVPRDLETVCWKCLEKKPSLRYISAAALWGTTSSGSFVAKRLPPVRKAGWVGWSGTSGGVRF